MSKLRIIGWLLVIVLAFMVYNDITISKDVVLIPFALLSHIVIKTNNHELLYNLTTSVTNISNFIKTTTVVNNINNFIETTTVVTTPSYIVVEIDDHQPSYKLATLNG